MSIDVLICTIGNGILKVADVMAEPRNDVNYLVSFQYTNKSDLNLIPDELKQRGDVKVLVVEGCGLAANRNYALSHAQADILLFADDDNRYTWGDFDRLLYVFNERPDVDALCLRSCLYNGELHREYSSQAFNLLNSPKGYYVRSCELALRNRKNIPKFDVHYGLGSEYLACGEEEVFVYDMIRRGLNVWYYPMTIVSTDHGTTGSLFNSLASVRRSKGAVLAAIHGHKGAMLRVLKYAMFNISGMSRVEALRDMLRGIDYAKKIGRC